MKKILKTTFATVCVAVACIGAFNAYDEQNKNIATSEVLLAENVEALSSGDIWESVISGLVSGWSSLFGGGSSEKWYLADCNEPCTFYKPVNGRDTLVNGTKKGCRETKAQTAGCTIPRYNPCHE